MQERFNASSLKSMMDAANALVYIKDNKVYVSDKGVNVAMYSFDYWLYYIHSLTKKVKPLVSRVNHNLAEQPSRASF